MKKVLVACLLAVLSVSLFPRLIMLKMGPYYGYYKPNEKIVKDIYGNGGSIYGARFGLTVWKLLSVWGNYAQYRMTAKTTFGQENTTMALNPLTFTVRFTAPLPFFIQPYAAAGYTFLDFKEESAIGMVHGTGSGFTGEGGFEIRFSTRLFMDFSMRYNSIKVKPEGSDVTADLGGLQFGGSFVIAF